MKVDVKALIKELEKPDGPENYKARVRLRNETARVGGKGQEAERAEFAAALAKAVVELQPKGRRRIYDRPFANTPMRNELLRSLCEIAGPAEVSVLMKAEDDFEVRDGVRRVLECIQGDESTAALVMMVVKGEGTEFRIGAINALGKRNTPGSLEALKSCAADPDPRIRLAAAEALSNRGDPSAQPVIMQSFDPRRGWAAHGDPVRTQLQLAANVAKAGNKAAADQIYRAVGSMQAQPFQSKAAQAGLQQQPSPRR
jgi:HEAT repeat protein